MDFLPYSVQGNTLGSEHSSAPATCPIGLLTITFDRIEFDSLHSAYLESPLSRPPDLPDTGRCDAQLSQWQQQHIAETKHGPLALPWSTSITEYGHPAGAQIAAPPLKTSHTGSQDLPCAQQVAGHPLQQWQRAGPQPPTGGGSLDRNQEEDQNEEEVKQT